MAVRGRIRVPVVAYVRAVRGSVRLALQALAPQVQQRMQTAAPWTNRTGAARAALFARAESAGVDQTRIVIGYDPRVLAAINKRWNGAYFYPISLESHHGGRYAILAPTAQSLRAEIGRTVASAIRRAR